MAEVQIALRHLLGRQAGPAVGPPAGEESSGRGDNSTGSAIHGGDTAAQVSVIAGHPGAGSSTVALALADAAATNGRAVHLLDPAAPGRSGLMAAAVTELGTDPSGTWRKGRRTSVVIERRALPGDGSSVVPGELQDDVLTVLDLGSTESTTASTAPTVVVCRANVPGFRLAEQRLLQLAGRPLVVAAVGPHGSAREVRASIGPRLAALRDTGRLVSVPWDSRLDVTGLTDRPLPRPVVAAGAQLLSLVQTVQSLDAGSRSAR
ncbi:hypothetical protein [Klenkia sp. PcliD-1-E]|uniref:hypothetical protein n=1 Tax=Klenkia sp. PcliD-1-E TaxID=2954492 RepID=UPI00209733BF|nr:hypothetical protein [Klenkia sp. PcliD-1-E]MCO7218585.1 hypothetical protein [Klenkia sp. PcliD-1-E]